MTAWLEKLLGTAHDATPHPSQPQRPVPAAPASSTAAQSQQPQGTGRVYARGVKLVAGSAWRSTSAGFSTSAATARIPWGQEPPVPLGQRLDLLA